MKAHDVHAKLARLLWLTPASASFALGAAGMVLPLLPTTPFSLLAAWAASKGSPRLANWLNRHRTFGPALHARQSEGAIPTRAKWTGIVLLVSSWMVLWLVRTKTPVLYLAGMLFTLIAIFLLTRPSPRCDGAADSDEVS